MIRSENLGLMQRWANFFHAWASLAFVKSYLATAENAAFLPSTSQELQVLLDAYLLEKAVYELGHELTYRPDWVDIPLRRLTELLKSPAIQDWTAEYREER
jgi:maltose alpha-D-glucosyltransferase/alpha-amylase